VQRTDDCVILHLNLHESKNFIMPIPVAVRSKAWVYGRSLTGIVVSNPTGGHVCLCCVCCKDGSMERKVT
jgi:hypothetical protein